MTTTVTSSRVGPFTASGVTPIPFTFQSLSTDEIEVERNGEVAPKNSYTVQRNADGTGSIVPSTSWGSDAVVISSAPDYSQPFSFSRFGAFFPDMLNAPLNRLARMIIALKNKPAGGTGLIKIGSVTTGEAGASAGVANVGTDEEAVLNFIIPRGEPGATPTYTGGGSGAVARPLPAKAGDVVSVKDYGAAGDGTTDDSAAIQAAINANSGKRILFPAGRYLINSAITVTTAPVTLDFSNRQATLVLGTQNMNGIVIGNGTEAGKNATIGTHIIGPVFNVKTGVAAFTSGACIFRNFVAFCNAYDVQIYGNDGTGAKLWTGVYDYMAQDCDTPNALIQQVQRYAIHCKGDGTTAGRTVGCNYDNLRATDFYKAVFVDEGCAGLGFYRPTIYGIGNGGWGMHISCTPGPNGQNFFIDTPDIEAQPLAAGAVWLERAQKTMINGGWIGASMNTGLLVSSGTDSCEFTGVAFNQSRVIIEGPSNKIIGGDLSGDIVSIASGITIRGDHTQVSGLSVRQWAAFGVDWGGATPTNVVLSGLSFRNNGTDIAPTTGFTPANIPTIGVSGTDKPRTAAAASTLSVSMSRAFVQVTGATAVATIPIRGQGSRITLQAGAGGITLNSSGNLILASGSTLAVPAFKTVSFVSDGANWFEDGRSF